MAYKVIGDLEVAGKINVNGKVSGVSITLTEHDEVYTADTNGHLDIPVPQKTDFDYILKQLPLTQYGAVNNVPVGVAGTFDGGSTLPYYSSMPLLLEDDGTLAFLRPGTNGSTINYYYSYIASPESSTKPTTTIRKYYTGSSKNIVFFDSYAKDTLIYQDVDNALIYVVLTNGTLENTKHQQASFSRNLIPHNIMSALKVGNYVYIISLYSSQYNVSNPVSANYNPNDPFQFLIHRIPVSQIQAGSISTVEQVSGITGNNMFGDANSSGNIRIADVWASTSDDTSVKSFMKYPSGTNIAPYTYSIIGAAKSYFDGNNIILSFYTNGYVVNGTERKDTMYGFSVTYNVANKTYSTDLSTTGLVCTGSSTGTLTWTNPYSINVSKTYGVGTGYTDGNSTSWYITDSGIQYAIKEKYVLGDTYLVSRCVINNFTNKADAYKVRSRTLTPTSYTNVNADFASRVGDQLVGGSPISSTRIMFTGTGTYEGNQYTKYYRGIADIGTASNYTYNSVDRGTITGYAPQAYRVPFGSENLMRSKLSYCDASGNVESFGCAFLEGVVLSTGYKFSASTLTYDTTVNISNSTLVTLKNSILANAGISAPADSKIGLYYSPKSDFCKSIAHVVVYNGSGLGGRNIFATVDCTLSGNTVNTAAMNTVIYNQAVPTMQSITSNPTETFAKSGLSCVKYSDFTYISFSGLFNYNLPGDSNELSACGVVSGNTVSSLIMSNSYHVTGMPGATASREYSYIPNLGFGYYIYVNTDKGTKLIFKNCGNTLAQFNANMSNGNGTDTVIIAQDVVVGFYLYFTERTPLFMSGQYFELPITTIDLNTVKVNPGNTKYYVYAKLQYGMPAYLVSETELVENETTMFIGTVQTDGTKVSALNITKVSKFDNYRPSANNIGGAFPVSTGNPLDSGTINW